MSRSERIFKKRKDISKLKNIEANTFEFEPQWSCDSESYNKTCSSFKKENRKSIITTAQFVLFGK